MAVSRDPGIVMGMLMGIEKSAVDSAVVVVRGSRTDVLCAMRLVWQCADGTPRTLSKFAIDMLMRKKV